MRSEYPQKFSPEQFTTRLLGWFAAHSRDLPWRTDYSPYAVWISEIMLQQTQMERGVAYFKRWMARFPTIADVAAAPEDALLKAWEGLGYYSRARNLAAAARRIMSEHGGEFPAQLEEIRALPGVGPYTAAAIASIAFNQDVPLIDANVNRLFSRLFDIDQPVRSSAAQSRIRAIAEDLLPRGKARQFNQALMEFGALVCRKKPLCADCPFPEFCEAKRLNIVADRPVLTPPKEIIPLTVATGVLRRPGAPDVFFLQKRRDDDVWPGLWEFPGGGVEAGEKPEQAVLREFAEETGFTTRIAAPITVIRHGYTRYRVTLHCFLLTLEAGQPDSPQLTEASAFAWVPLARLGNYAMPAVHRKLADMLEDFSGGLDREKA